MLDTYANSYNVIKKEARENPRLDREKIMQATRLMIEALGDNPDREGLRGTPDRVARAYEELFEGMNYTNDQIADMFDTCFHTNTEGLVAVGQIPINSFCEHHILPMINMTASIGYIPSEGRVIGLSKLARIADLASKRLQLQERIGEDIAYIVQKVSQSPDVIVVIEGEHTCMTMRGEKARGTVTRTATLRGRFITNIALRQEFYSLIKK